MSDQDVIREALRRSETFEARSASEAFNALERLSAALETAQRQVEDVTRYWNASIDEREGLERALEAAQRSSQEWHDAAEAQRTGRLEAERERDTLKAALEQILSYKVRTTYTATLMQTDAREALAAAREKPPCLYPLEDGRRCLECDACQGLAAARETEEQHGA